MGQACGNVVRRFFLLLCAAESLVVKGGFDACDLGERFRRMDEPRTLDTARDAVDIGIATSKSIWRICSGTPPESAGGH
jgi:hypothetical protein